MLVSLFSRIALPSLCFGSSTRIITQYCRWASLRGSTITTCDIRITAEESVLGNESSRSHRHATLVYGSLDSTYLHPMCAQRKAQNDHLYRQQNSIEQSPLKKVASVSGPSSAHHCVTLTSKTVSNMVTGRLTLQ
ncbi:hypothetical protein EV421DRAFT_403464 [Armillaria borealis]|uniref:Secreted protein n=1 Tax=Armillaria borealis TaxID=47425 RepID=A0AA39IUP9_9AGAR|nr:hypothetical protein EV421DRAFT_403464 [Armillaria borealis]